MNDRASDPVSDAYALGLEVRKHVMGADFVERAAAGVSDFTRPLQHFINEHAWGSVWCRPGLDLKKRSLITVAMLTALGRTYELAGHVRGALRNGVTAEELREVLLHSAVYCGVPIAAEAFRCAQAVVEEWSAEQAACFSK